MRHLICLILLPLPLAACGLLHFWEEQHYRQIVQPANFQNIRCQSTRPHYPLFATSDQSALDELVPVMEKLIQQHQLTFVETAVAWSLLQMYIRPDRALPGAQYQVVIRRGEQFPAQYWSFTRADVPADGKMLSLPFLFANDYLLQHYGGPHSLQQLALLIDQQLATNLTLFPTSASYLDDYRQQLQANPRWERRFFRGGELIQAGESYQRPLLQKLFTAQLARRWRTMAAYHITGPEDGLSQCHFSPQPTAGPMPALKAHSFFYANGKGELFFAATTFATNKMQPLPPTAFFHGENYSPLAAVCFAHHGPDQLITFSLEGPLPEQHLQRLFPDGLLPTLSPQLIDQQILNPRQLLLQYPLRILYEAQRATADEINTMANSSLPVYPIPSLGQIWASYATARPKAVELFIDTRRPGAISCPKTLAN